MYIFIGLVVAYIIGFFAMTPIAMHSVVPQYYPLINITHSINSALYWSWVKELDENNLIRKAWNNNGLYWCNKVETCKVNEDEKT